MNQALDPETGKPRKFAYPPNLLVVDGAGPQATAAADVLASSVSPTSPWSDSPNGWRRCGCPPTTTRSSCRGRRTRCTFCSECVTRRTGSRIRYQRQKRSKRVQESVLDGIPGLGQVRKAALIKHFGSVKKIREATVAEIAAVPGFGNPHSRGGPCRARRGPD